MIPKSLYQNAKNAQDRTEKATRMAQETLLARGVHYPINDPRRPPEENYDLLEAYRQKESNLIIRYLKEMEPRPVEEPKPERPIKQWAKPYYDE